MDKNSKKLIKYIGQEKYNELMKKIPKKYKKENIFDFSECLLKLSEQKILDFYEKIINDTKPWSIIKICGSIIILSTHLEALLKKLICVRETEKNLIKDTLNFNLHHLILFCVARYNISEDYFIDMIKFKHFRNMIAHDFNNILKIDFKKASELIPKGSLLIILLTKMIKE